MDEELIAVLKKSPLVADLQRANDEAKLAERRTLVEKFEAERSTAEKEIARLEKLAEAAADKWRKAEEIATKARIEAANANSDFLSAKRNLDFAEDRLEDALAQGANPLLSELAGKLRDEIDNIRRPSVIEAETREREVVAEYGRYRKVTEVRSNRDAVLARMAALRRLAAEMIGSGGEADWRIDLDQSDSAIRAKFKAAYSALPQIKGLPAWPL